MLLVMLSNYGVTYFRNFVTFNSLFFINLYSKKKNEYYYSFFFFLKTVCLVSPNSF